MMDNKGKNCRGNANWSACTKPIPDCELMWGLSYLYLIDLIDRGVGSLEKASQNRSYIVTADPQILCNTFDHAGLK